MRIAAKRLRYVLEATGFCFGRPADRARRRARDLQDVLGELHDCDVMLPRVDEHVEAPARRGRGRPCAARAGDAEDLEPGAGRPAPAPHRLPRPRGARGPRRGAARRCCSTASSSSGESSSATRTWERLERAIERKLARRQTALGGGSGRVQWPRGRGEQTADARARASARRRRVGVGDGAAGRRPGQRAVRRRARTGVGDPFFPKAGNGGYDVGHYALELATGPSRGKLVADAPDRGHRDPGPERLRPRLPRPAGQRGDGRRRRRRASTAPGQELIVTPGDRDRRRRRVRGRGRLPRQARGAARRRRLGRRAGSRPTTAPSSSASRRARRPGFPATTTRPTRRPTRSGSRSRAASRRSPTARWSSAAAPGGGRPGPGTPTQPMATYLATATIGDFQLERSQRRRDRVAGRGRPAARRGRRSGRCGGSARMIRLFRSLFGPYPFGQTRRDRRPRAAGRLRARDPDPPDLRRRSGRGHGRPRARPPVVRRLRQPRALAGHLAQRGLRDLGGVALGRGARRPDDGAGVRASSMRTAGATGHDLGPAARGDPGGPRSCSPSSVYIRGGMALEALRQQIGDAAFSPPCAPGRRRTPTATRRSTSSSRSPRRPSGRGARRAVPALPVRARASPSAARRSLSERTRR